MNCVQWRMEGGDGIPHWRDRDEYVERFGLRNLIFTGELATAQSWPWSSAAIVVAQRGRVRASHRHLCVELAGNDVLVCDGGASLRLEPIGPGNAVVTVLWLAPDGRTADVLPAVHAQDVEFAIALARGTPAGTPSGSSPDLADAANLLARRQQDLALPLENCPGRSDRHRRQLFARLLRAKNLIDHGEAVPLDLAALADIANLSPSHFLRLFHRVFGVSPHRYLVQQRMLRARRLVVETSVPIGLVAQRLGFVNRCAFARLFKQHFGVPATRLRRQAVMQARPVVRGFGKPSGMARPAPVGLVGMA
jgi:AraC family transcriptional regulator